MDFAEMKTFCQIFLVSFFISTSMAQNFVGTNAPGQGTNYSFSLTAGATNLSLVVSNSAGAYPDLYIRRGLLPQTSAYHKASVGQTIDTIIFDNTEATADTYFIGVYLPAGASSDANYTLSAEVGYLATLTWDPGTTHLGTQVFT